MVRTTAIYTKLWESTTSSRIEEIGKIGIIRGSWTSGKSEKSKKPEESGETWKSEESEISEKLAESE